MVSQNSSKRLPTTLNASVCSLSTLNRSLLCGLAASKMEILANLTKNENHTNSCEKSYAALLLIYFIGQDELECENDFLL